MEQEEINMVKNLIEEFLGKMTIADFVVELGPPSFSQSPAYVWPEKGLQEDAIKQDALLFNITAKDPQFLIGQNGQTLAELERLIRILAHKKLKKNNYIALDINGYKKNKIQYLKKIAEDAANEVSIKKKSKIMSPMPSYDRRIIHTELAHRQDVATESQGEGLDRHVVVNPRQP